MPYGLYLSAAGANAHSQRVDVISNNVANAQTPGFKRELAVLQARPAEAISQGLAQPGSRDINDLGGGVYLRETLTDYAAGALRETKMPADLALDGDGFFLVMKDDEQRLTRAGNFHVAADGQLLAADGAAVLSEDGQPIVIDPSTPWQFDAAGNLVQQGAKTPLAIVRPKSHADLVKAGDNQFRPLAAVDPVDPSQRSVRVGYLEHSGANPILEMTQLIEATRAYEANIRMIQNQDQTLGALFGRLLRVA